jgi:flavodoxin
MNKTLIIYYSRRGENYVKGNIRNLAKGNTEIVAEQIAQKLDADLFQLETVKTYPANYRQCTEEAQKEKRAKARPALKEIISDISSYDNIIVAGPCWWGTYPMAIFTQLDALDLTGKHLFPVMTHEGSGMGRVESDLAANYPEAELGEGLAIRGSEAAHSPAQIDFWIQRNFK